MEMKRKILLIEDEPGLRVTLGDRLSSEGYGIETAADGEVGFERASSEDFDLIILDLLLPGKGGLDVCRDLRQQGLGTPILMLTARDQMVDKVLGLKIGADDYLTKPFDMPELLARIEALLRRTSKPAAGAAAVYQFGPIRVDFRKTEVLRDGQSVPMSAKEFQLLRYFIENRGNTISREELLRQVWGYTSTPHTRTVDVHIAWLRQKLEEDPKQPRWILTVHKLGYRFAG
jgi:two-component system alkaline phosphatase synthesis response regulator PhoP